MRYPLKTLVSRLLFRTARAGRSAHPNMVLPPRLFKRGHYIDIDGDNGFRLPVNSPHASRRPQHTAGPAPRFEGHPQSPALFVGIPLAGAVGAWLPDFGQGRHGVVFVVVV